MRGGNANVNKQRASLQLNWSLPSTIWVLNKVANWRCYILFFVSRRIDTYAPSLLLQFLFWSLLESRTVFPAMSTASEDSKKPCTCEWTFLYTVIVAAIKISYSIDERQSVQMLLLLLRSLNFELTAYRNNLVPAFWTDGRRTDLSLPISANCTHLACNNSDMLQIEADGRWLVLRDVNMETWIECSKCAIVIWGGCGSAQWVG